MCTENGLSQLLSLDGIFQAFSAINSITSIITSISISITSITDKGVGVASTDTDRYVCHLMCIIIFI